MITTEEAVKNMEQLIVPDSIQKAHLANVVTKITQTDYQQLVNDLLSQAMWIGLKILLALAIFFVGKWITNWIIRILNRAFERKNVDLSLRNFLRSMIKVVMMILVILAAIQTLGINTTSFLAIFASAGLAVGMALSGTLQNFAGGVMILLFRPFKVGDFIEAQGVSGVVKEIQIFNTVIHTGDNKVLLLPNGPVSTGIINNYSREPKRRLDMTFSIAYGDDFEKAKKVLTKLIAEDGRVLDAPAAPFIELGALSASSIDIVVRMWCKQEDYWGIKFDLNKKVYETFPKEGLNFPYQTFTVNVNK